MKPRRIADYLAHMRQAASQAIEFVEGMEREDFLDDSRTQQATVMNLIIIGEAAARLSEHYPDFAAHHSKIPWHDMRGMRNRIAHGYFDIDFDVVWDTIHISLPNLLILLAELSPDEG